MTFKHTLRVAVVLLAVLAMSGIAHADDVVRVCAPVPVRISCRHPQSSHRNSVHRSSASLRAHPATPVVAVTRSAAPAWCAPQMALARTPSARNVRCCDTPIAKAQHVFITAGGGGDPHFIGLDGSTYEFHGVSGLNFMLVTEPESQLNAQFHNLGMHADNTYIKALGFVHAPSGHRVTVDTKLEDCSAGVPLGHALAIEVDGKLVDSKLQTTVNHPSLDATLLQLLKDKGMVVDYHATNHDGQLAEHLSIHSDRLKYTIHRNAGSCHLDMDMAVLDPELLGSTSMHGVLGQTARWVSKPDARQVVQGDESEYIESTLTSRDSKYSILSSAARAGQATRRMLFAPLDPSASTLAHAQIHHWNA